MKYQELPPNLSRCFEICLTGGHSIALVGALNIREYIEAIKVLLPELQFLPPDKADIIYEVTVDPDYIRSSTHNEDKEDVMKRVYGVTFPPPDLTPTGEMLYKTAASKLSLSPLDRDKIIKLAQTIAGLSKDERIEVQHLAEAIQYRSFDLHRSAETEVLVEVPERYAGGYKVEEIGGKLYYRTTFDNLYIH